MCINSLSLSLFITFSSSSSLVFCSFAWDNTWVCFSKSLRRSWYSDFSWLETSLNLREREREGGRERERERGRRRGRGREGEREKEREEVGGSGQGYTMYMYVCLSFLPHQCFFQSIILLLQLFELTTSGRSLIPRLTYLILKYLKIHTQFLNLLF